MKKVIFILGLIFSVGLFGQDTSNVITFDANKETLYSNALSFFATTFKSANDVIQMKDPESGKVIGKGYLSKDRPVTITITCKDGKYKYEISSDKVYEVFFDLGIDKWNDTYKGKTFLRVKFDKGKPIVNKENSFFVWAGNFTESGYKSAEKNGFELAYKVFYDGTNNCMGVTQKGIEKHRRLIDESFEKNYQKIISSRQPFDSDWILLIAKLRTEMEKSDW